MFSNDFQNNISSANSTLSIYLANANNMTSLSLSVDSSNISGNIFISAFQQVELQYLHSFHLFFY